MMEKMMRQMGISQTDLDATEVIIKLKNEEIVITDPSVQKITTKGQVSFQISGDLQTRSLELFSAEDIEMIVNQTNCTKEQAKQALEQEGDIAAAILKLQNK